MEVGSVSSGMMAQMQPPPTKEEMFDILDTNEDGVVSEEELSALTQAIGRQSNQSVDTASIFSELDEDGDGVLSIDEMPDAPEPPPPPPEATGGSQTFSGSGGLMGGLGGIGGKSGGMGLDAMLAAIKEDSEESDSEDEESEEELSASNGIQNSAFKSFLDALKQSTSSDAGTEDALASTVSDLLELATSYTSGVDVVA